MIESIETSTAKRLHWSSLLFDIASHLWGYVIPIGIALLGAARGDLFWTLLAGFFFLLSLLRSCIRYLTLTYSIENRKLVVKQGILFQNNRTVPVRRIQNIDLVQNLFHRLLDVAEVKIETASGSEPEAVLRVLAMSQIEQLRNEIFEAQQQFDKNSINGSEIPIASENNLEDPQAPVVADSGAAETASSQPVAALPNSLAPTSVIIGLPASWLIFAGLASNRGFILVGVLLGIVYQIADQSRFLQQIDPRLLRQWIPKDLNQAAADQAGWDLVRFWFSVVIAIVFVLLALRVLGVIWYLLRFSGYQLSRRADDLRISCGLFTRVSATVPRPRIQFICIRQNLISRWFGFCSIQVETAGGSRGTDAKESVSGRWFLPVLPISELPRVLAEIKPGLDWHPQNWDWQTLHPKAFKRMTRLGTIKVILVGIAAGYFFPPWGWIAGLALFPLTIGWLRFKANQIAYARFDRGVAHRYGVLNRIINLAFFETIQAIEVSRSPFDRRWKMATLAIDTAGSGPADSVINISMLHDSFTASEQADLVALTSRHRLNILGKN